MNIHEYQAKQLLARFSVPVPPGEAVGTPDEARAVAKRLFADGHARVVVKAQIHAGGRGKGAFKTGLQGGVRVCASADEVLERAQAMLGQVLVTRQTGPEGRVVSKLLIEAGVRILREYYCAVLLDRAAGCPVLMVSTEGGMDIEEVAAHTPDRIVRERVNPAMGMQPFQARKLAVALGWQGDLIRAGEKLLLGVYRAWWESDASLVELNPLAMVESPTGKPALLALDAKVGLDDNGLFRHPDLQALRDLTEEAPLEVEASHHGLNYIKLDGAIACLVNGAGLAMATMDLIQHCGGNNVRAGKQTLKDSGLPILSGDSMADAARTAVRVAV
jgi:succinyl-CoA synthetase beta subunit